MTKAEKYLFDHICEICHVAIIETHPEDQLASIGWKKCPICAFSKLIEPKKSELYRILNGRSE